MKRGWIRLVLIASAVLLLPAALSVPVLAAPEPVKMSLTASPGFQGQIQVEARLTGPDGKPVGMQTVSIGIGTEFLGGQMILLGKELTDSAGIATFLYRPTENGDHQFVARFGGDANFAPSDAKLTYAITGLSDVSVSTSHDPASQLVPIWRLTGLVGAVLTAIVWVILLFTLIRVRVGIGRTGSRRRFKPLAQMASSIMKGD